MAKVREHHILDALAKRHGERDVFFTHVKNGRTHAAQTGELAIIDALAIAKSWSRPVIRGYEVKVERSDFLRDTKWHKYFDMCHEFSFVCPKGLIEPDEIPEQAGLIYYNHEKRTLHTKKKAVYRDIEMPVDMLWYIIIAKLDSERHPFFTERRQYLEEWVSDKEERTVLGRVVSDKLYRLSHEIIDAQRRLQGLSELEKDVNIANEILGPYGVHIGTWGRERWQEKLKAVLQQGGSPDLSRIFNLAKSLEEELESIQKVQSI